MLNVSRPWSAAIALLSLTLCASALRAQAVPETPLQHQISRLDLGVTAVGQFTKDVSGTELRSNQTLTQKASSTVGVLVTLRYIKSPFVGFEANYAQARYTENYSRFIIGGAQTKAAEYSLGYVAHLPSILGLQPFAAAGIGTTAFTPTAGGGQGLPEQARITYYYNAGADYLVAKHLGIRASIRQTFYKAPDFGQNYLTINQRTNTFEPSVGFFLKF